MSLFGRTELALLRVAEHRLALAEAEVTEAKRLHEMERRRFDDLLEKYHALKLQGAAVPEPAPKLPEYAPDPIQLAISRKAGANRTLRTHYAQEAHRMKAQHVSVEEIVATIDAGDDATAWGVPG